MANMASGSSARISSTMARPVAGSIPRRSSTDRSRTSKSTAPFETMARPSSPTCSHRLSIHRSGRPVTKTTGTPRPSTAASTDRVYGDTVPSLRSNVPSRSVAISRGRDESVIGSVFSDRAQGSAHHEMTVLVAAAQVGETAGG